MKLGVTYRVPNVCRLSGDFIYFIADVPHLIKTIRNAWYNSQDRRSRHLVVSINFLLIGIGIYFCIQNNGVEIKWSHLIELAEKATVSTGLYIGRNLTREHTILTSYSRMTVRLAVQISYIFNTLIRIDYICVLRSSVVVWQILSKL